MFLTNLLYFGIGMCIALNVVHVVGNKSDVKQSTRIVGGIPAKLGEFKAQVSLQNFFRSHACGGTLLDERHIVTAAHCYQSQQILTYVMGDDLLISWVGSKTRQIRLIQSFVVHPNYNKNNLENDIAIIRLDVPFRLSLNFGPVERSKRTPSVGDRCEVVGWGYTTNETYAKISPTLLKTQVQVRDNQFCNSSLSYEGLIKPGMFCAGDLNGKSDSCQGDSGGYLTCNGKHLTGIVSFGYNCGLPNYPGVYVDVSKYNDWLDEMIAKEHLPQYEYAADPTEAPPPSIITDNNNPTTELFKPTEPNNSTETLLTTQSISAIVEISQETFENPKGSKSNTILSSSLLCLICMFISIYSSQ